MGCVQGCDDSSRRDVNFFLAADFTDLESTLASSPALHTALSLQVCHNHGFKAFEAPLGGITPSRGVLLVAFFRTLFGTSRLLALCNVIGLQVWAPTQSFSVGFFFVKKTFGLP